MDSWEGVEQRRWKDESSSLKGNETEPSHNSRVEHGAHKKYEVSYGVQVVECMFWVGNPEGANHADHYAPAPVVPPARCEDSNEGDWWIVNSFPWIDTSTDGARESIIPKLLLGTSWAKRRKASMGSVSSYRALVDLPAYPLPHQELLRQCWRGNQSFDSCDEWCIMIIGLWDVAAPCWLTWLISRKWWKYVGTQRDRN